MYIRLCVYWSVWWAKNDKHVPREVAHLAENWSGNKNEVTEFLVYFLWRHNMGQNCTIRGERGVLPPPLPGFLDIQMPTYGGVDACIHIFFTSALTGGECSASRPCRFTPDERTCGIHWIGGWGGPQSRYGRRGEEQILPLLGLELHVLALPACRQSVYWIRYPGSELKYDSK
jgi:hypothetical protein